MTVALRPVPVSRPSLFACDERARSLLDTFLSDWPGTHPKTQLLGLMSELNRCGWRCAVVDGGLETRAWKLLTSSGRNRRQAVASIGEGLRALEDLQESRQFDLVILYDVPCSLARVSEWLTWTPGSGAVLWLRGVDAALFEEKKSESAPWIEWCGTLFEKFIKFLDRWGS